ncbi:MAG: hypothetical protein KAT56_11335 [Sedimentisphaerales bacterium]|nr:hypothetical protein [Sedimentisphaerales bacterium]
MLSIAVQIILLTADVAEKTEKTPSISSSVLWVFAVVVLAYFMLRVTMRKVARRQKSQQRPLQERLAQMRKPDGVYDQMNELMAALADLSRQINGQIDTRLAKLDVMLRQADQVISRLENSTGSSLDTAHTNDSASVEEAADSPFSADSPFNNASDSLREIADKIQAADPATDNSRSSDKIETKLPGSSNISPVLTPEAKQIIAMADKGLSTLTISQELKRPVGEIELILSLAGKKDEPDQNH